MHSSPLPPAATAAAESLPLAGIRVVVLAVNVPGPVAASRLLTLGAQVTKVEPPGGDQLERLCPTWYAAIHPGMTIRRLDLRDADGQTALHALLETADLLVTSYRPQSLQRLGLDRATLTARHPALCQVAIVGESGALADIAGHDLTYQARVGLLTPPAMPRTLLADLVGAERAVSAALALLFGRERHASSRDRSWYAEVALADAVEGMMPPLRHGLTSATGVLGGTLPAYGLYAARDGWIAVAALEPHFAARLADRLGLAALTRDALAERFAGDSAAAWEAWAEAHDLPIVAVPMERETAG